MYKIWILICECLMDNRYIIICINLYQSIVKIYYSDSSMNINAFGVLHHNIIHICL